LTRSFLVHELFIPPPSLTTRLLLISCDHEIKDDLGKNPLPKGLPKQLFPESKMHLAPFPEPSLVAKWQKSRLDPSSDPMPQCDEVGACTCAGEKIFNGRRCIDGWGDDPYKALRERWAAAPLKVQAKDTTPTTPEAFAAYWEENAMFDDAWTAVSNLIIHI
jgi:hypothetical protein